MMSWWTDVLLTASNLEDIGNSDAPDQYFAVDRINDWLNRAPSGLFLIRPANPVSHGPSSCFAGSFKTLDRDGFIQAVQTAPWQWQEQVQLFLRQEDDLGFQEIKLWAKP